MAVTAIGAVVDLGLVRDFTHIANHQPAGVLSKDVIGGLARHLVVEVPELASGF
ncbi:MAG: hypothetical protein M0Z39_03955 [Actinomycetota bacterium]|nr:hypothetical protein [Actinomycetota bacterium]